MPAVRLAWRDGRTERIEVGEGNALLDAAEERGIDLPFGCRTGACGTCTAKLHAGNVSYLRPPRALKDRHRDAGYVLTCIATPTTDGEVEVGTRLQAEMMDTPWK